jgi:hypothetical protein
MLACGFSPKEILIDLPGPNQVFKLFEPGKCSELECFLGQVNPSEQLQELLCSASCIPLALKPGQMFSDLLERNPIATVVEAWWTERNFATREYFAHDLSDLPHSIVVGSVAHIKDLIRYRFHWRLKHAGNGLGDIQTVHDWAPRCSIASHGYFIYVQARPAKLFRTTSKRIRVDAP